MNGRSRVRRGCYTLRVGSDAALEPDGRRRTPFGGGGGWAGALGTGSTAAGAASAASAGRVGARASFSSLRWRSSRAASDCRGGRRRFSPVTCGSTLSSPRFPPFDTPRKRAKTVSLYCSQAIQSVLWQAVLWSGYSHDFRNHSANAQ